MKKVNDLVTINKRMIPVPLKRMYRRFRDFYFWDDYSQKCWSQEGEDLLLDRYFELKKENGFYVDVGAHHPKRFSNTFKFYLKGWRGINIDAMPGSMNLFNKMRKNDINLEIAISDTETDIDFYMFNEPALNTFSKVNADEYLTNNDIRLVSIKTLHSKKLSEILLKNLALDINIDFLTVDVEGFDLKVLKSNNWDMFRPQVVLVEYFNYKWEELLDSELYSFMLHNGYELYAKTCNTVFFTKKFH